MDNSTLNRRSFCGLSIGAVLARPEVLRAAAPKALLQFGIIADIHQSLMPGAQDRLESFLDAAGRRQLDFLIQLGDFCHGYTPKPTDDQKRFLKTWHQVRTPKYNVLGNHEMDRSSKDSIMNLLEMPKNYYSFDRNGFHHVILDCMHVNENGKFTNYVEGSYFHRPAEQINWVDPEQMDWLAADLQSTELPTLVFTHPCINAFWAKGAHETRRNVKDTFDKANAGSRGLKVVACFSGHHHVDNYSKSNGVNYFLVNSASYYWVGEAYGSMAKYTDPLYAFVTLYADGSLAIEGKVSTFIPPSPTDLHHPDALYVTPSIEARNVRLERNPRA